MSFARLVMTQGRKTLRQIQQLDRQVSQAGYTAARVEGFRLSKLLKQELQAGSPGGKTLPNLTMIAQKLRRGRNKNRLSGLSRAVRYRSEKTAAGYTVSVGFVDPVRGQALSNSWKKIAEKQQAGWRFRPTDKAKRFFCHIGKGLGKRSKYRRFFFITKNEVFDVPASPVIDPFWSAHQGQAVRNVQENYRRKLRGERI